MLAKFRHQSSGFSDLLNYAAVVDDGIVLNKDGSLLSSWLLKGPDLASATPSERNALVNRASSILSRLGTGWTIHIDAIRSHALPYPPRSASAFPDQLSQLIDDERRALFEQGPPFYESTYGLSLTFHPPVQKEGALRGYLFSGDSGSKRLGDRALQTFKEFTREIIRDLSLLMDIEPLGLETVHANGGETIVLDHLAAFLSCCISGARYPLRLPGCAMYLDAILGSTEMYGGIAPRLGNTHFSIISVDGFPDFTTPNVLSALDQYDATYRWNTRFICLDTTDGQREIAKYRRKWQQKMRGFVDQLFRTSKGATNLDAVRMAEETDNASSDLSSRKVSFGYYTSVIILMDENREKLLKDTDNISAIVNSLGFRARVETLNTMEAYLGSLPGHTIQNVRRPLVSSRTLCDLLPLTSVWPGKSSCPSPLFPTDSPPLLIGRAHGTTPFRVNLHVGDVGHTLIFGPTGAGKSTLLSVLIAQFCRYKGAKIFAFDKGRSLMPITLALGGNHYSIGDSGLKFSPLQSIFEGERGILEASTWIEIAVSLQGISLNPTSRRAIHEALQRLSNSDRVSLHDFRLEVQNREIQEAINFYTIDGPLGHILDEESSSLGLSRLQTFELETVMSMGPQAVIPVLIHLFQRIERALDGAPSLIVLDEAWLMLGHEVFRGKIREWLKTLRKANCAVILATQSLSDATRSGIVDVLLESCPTMLLLPNTRAREESSRTFYEAIGLNERELEIISQEALPKRDYYYVSPLGRRLFSLDLGDVALSFCGKSDKESLARIQELYELNQSEWAFKWLNEHGVQYESYLT